MGIKKLSKKIRNTRKAHDSFAQDERIKSKRFGLDISVFLHKAISCDEGAGEFHLQPAIPITKVETVCKKLIGLFKRADATLVVCFDGDHHILKNEENKKRRTEHSGAAAHLKDILLRENPDQHVEEAKKMMKQATYVRPDIIAHAVSIFKEHKVETYGAIYEADFQLWYWEMTGFTHGTISVDSDIFAMGSKDANSLFIDLLNVESSDGKCKIIKRDVVWKQDLFGKGSSGWCHDDFLVFCAICGSDYSKRLYRLKDKEIYRFMETYTREGLTNEQKDRLLISFAENKYWPPGKKKGGSEAKCTGADFVGTVKRCKYMWKYAPVIKEENGLFVIAPLNALPARVQWADLIGFDPVERFANTDIQSIYHMEIWARTLQPLATLPLPRDPDDDSREIPHGSIIDFNKMSPHFIASSALLQWLYYRGVPHPKGARRQELIQQVELAIDAGQSLDHDRISLDAAQKAQSYISWDRILVEAEVAWSSSTDDALALMRGNCVANIDSTWIDDKFGEGRNGVRNRAWLRFVSGHLNAASIRHAKTRIKGHNGEVTIFEMKVTPSMKSEIYSVYLIFLENGEYVHDASKCDCPNGWLFCSHMLAFVLYIYLVQHRVDWTYPDVVSFMPEPIKTLQSIAFSAEYVAGLVTKGRAKKGAAANNDNNGSISLDQCEAEIAKVGKRLAQELPNYSADAADTTTTTKDTDSEEETSAIKDNLCRSGSVGRDGHGGDNACNVRENERPKIAETPKLQGTRRTGSAYQELR
mmetsp:Transcript_36508/g.74330  ORF Transcript_36508/g.74330 Transcript_36508/m.74330 type:complete len:757 (-) Transcript_36508:306-2576(-)